MHNSPITRYEAADIRARHEAVRAWLKDHKTNAYRTEELAAAGIVAPTNTETSNLEVFEFLHDPPIQYFAYVRRENKQVTTWMGQALSEWCRLGHEYRGNMGDKRRSIEFMGINNVRYVGTYYCGAGDYCRVRRAKQ